MAGKEGRNRRDGNPECREASTLVQDDGADPHLVSRAAPEWGPGSSALLPGQLWSGSGLGLGNDTSSRGFQSAALIAAASIQAAVALFGLTIGAIVLQVMGKYSWTVIRNSLPKSLLPVLAVAIGGGVVLPLWVSFSPTRQLSTVAFTGFGWSVLLTVASAWQTARRMNPQAVSTHARHRAVVELTRDKAPGATAFTDTAEVLGQLAADVGPRKPRAHCAGTRRSRRQTS